MGEAKQEEAKAEVKPEEKKEEKQEEKAEEKKEEAKPSPPPPVVLFMDLHCVGCAKKIERSLLKCRGVEEVMVDMVQNQITVKGMVEPQALCNRIQKKTMRKVTILSPLPPAEGEPKPEVVVNPQVATVELCVNMHCEACAQQLQRKILKMRGVQSVETNLSSGKVAVTGTMNGDKIVEYIHRRTGKLATIIPPPPPPKEEEKKEEGEKKSEEKPPEEEKKEEKVEEKKEEEKAPQQEGSNEEGGKKEGEEKGSSEEQKEGEVVVTTNNMISEEDMVKRMVYWNGGIITEEEMARRMMMHWMPVYVVERPPPPPQLFSDENPNACCIS